MPPCLHRPGPAQAVLAQAARGSLLPACLPTCRCVTPYVLVPGKWSAADLEYVADSVAAGLTNNAGRLPASVHAHNTGLPKWDTNAGLAMPHAHAQHASPALPALLNALRASPLMPCPACPSCSACPQATTASRRSCWSPTARGRSARRSWTPCAPSWPACPTGWPTTQVGAWLPTVLACRWPAAALLCAVCACCRGFALHPKQPPTAMTPLQARTPSTRPSCRDLAMRSSWGRETRPQMGRSWRPAAGVQRCMSRPGCSRRGSPRSRRPRRTKTGVACFR